MDDEKKERIRQSDRDIAERTRKGMEQAFPKPGTNWGDKLKGLMGLSDYNSKVSESLSKRQQK